MRLYRFNKVNNWFDLLKIFCKEDSVQHNFKKVDNLSDLLKILCKKILLLNHFNLFICSFENSWYKKSGSV